MKKIHSNGKLNLLRARILDSVNLNFAGLKSGINFHHFWHFSTYINANTYISIGYNHISNGKIFSKEVGSLFDMLVLGISYSFQDRI